MTIIDDSDKPPACPPVQVCRVPVDKPQPAVDFLHAHGGGVMDLIAHFWERLPQTPPLQRADLHLVVAPAGGALRGAMLYVPKAHRADVLALDRPTAQAFADYIRTVPSAAPADDEPRSRNGNGGPKPAIDFLTGAAEGVEAMVPRLLPLLNKRVPARQLVNVVMQLPAEVAAVRSGRVRLARDADLPLLNRWRKLYKEERGIIFDADLDAWVQAQRVFVFEHGEQIAAVAKFDLELQRLIEIGGVFTFPEFRNQGLGRQIVSDLAARIREAGKIPTLQVDRTNAPALHLYQHSGWRSMGALARVWLTG